jgi:nucleoside-diphosphate-sugar epimerase
MNILITGGAGYVGSMLIQKIFESDIEFDKLTVLDNLMYRQTSLTQFCYHDKFEFIQGDVRHREEFLPLVQKADVIIPLAAYVGFPACDRDVEAATKVNFEQIKFIIENTSRDQKIIYPNTDSAYGQTDGGEYCTEETPLVPTSHYGRTKTQSEYALRDANRGIVLRLATVFGIAPRIRLDLLINDFTFKAVTDGYIVLFERHFKRNFVHVQDVATAFIFMLKNYEKYNGEVFNVGNTEANMTKLELCETIQKHVPKFSINVEEFNTDPDKRNYVVDNSKLENEGWSCEFSVDDGIRELIKAYRMIIHNKRKSYTNL